LRIAGRTNRANAVTEFQDLLDVESGAPDHDLDVVEPVAAAVYVHEARPESREVCLLVDIGAGTTDIAAFVGYEPEARDVRRKFIFATDPVSVPRAGDVIDDAIEQLLARKDHCRQGSVARADLHRRRRSLKEDLFNNGRAAFGTAIVTREEVEKSPQIVRMAEEVSAAVTSLLRSSARRIRIFRGWGGGTNTIELVFVGGGANIEFLHRAVGNAARESTGMRIRIARRLLSSRGLPASPERLAVCLGGTAPKESWPETQMKDPDHWRGLPA
jgi:actin-like ATPase involved in cell morphogenesis